MPEPKHSDSPSQPPQSNGTRPSNPLTEPRRGSMLPGEEKVRAALRDGDPKAIEGLGPRAKPVLFRIIQDTDEDFAMRRFAADSIISLYGAGIRAYDRVLCLLLNEKCAEAASLGDDAAIPLLNILKNRKESLLLRGIAVEALVSIEYAPNSLFTLSVAAALSNLLANELEAPALRAKIADEMPRLAGFCDDAKIRMISSGLEKAARGEDSCVASAAEDALEMLGMNIRDCIDDNPTLPVAPKKEVPL